MKLEQLNRTNLKDGDIVLVNGIQGKCDVAKIISRSEVRIKLHINNARHVVSIDDIIRKV